MRVPGWIGAIAGRQALAKIACQRSRGDPKLLLLALDCLADLGALDCDIVSKRHCNRAFERGLIRRAVIYARQRIATVLILRITALDRCDLGYRTDVALTAHAKPQLVRTNSEGH